MHGLRECRPGWGLPGWPTMDCAPVRPLRWGWGDSNNEEMDTKPLEGGLGVTGCSTQRGSQLAPRDQSSSSKALPASHLCPLLAKLAGSQEAGGSALGMGQKWAQGAGSLVLGGPHVLWPQ